MSNILEIVTKLNRDINHETWTSATRYGAPHKPLFLLSLSDLYESNTLIDDNVPCTGPILILLGERFQSYWGAVIQNRRGEMVLPFWHLTTDEGIWEMVPRGKTPVRVNRPRSFLKMAEEWMGGRLSADLLITMKNAQFRRELRSTLISTYFDEKTRKLLYELSDQNRSADMVSNQLLGRPIETRYEGIVFDNQGNYLVGIKGRSQGFRVAVRSAYLYRCAACGIRIVTPEGSALVQGAHIRPWSHQQDDRIVNGISLCSTCHWCFDQGLWTISHQLLIQVSPILSWENNIPSHLGALHLRPIFLPEELRFNPDQDSLTWHRDKCFRVE